MPYRVAASVETAQALGARVEATFERLGALELNALIRDRVESARKAFDRGDVDVIEVLLFLQRVVNELDSLPTELPPLQGGVGTTSMLHELPRRVTELQVAGNLAVFRCDGHPMVHELLEADVVQMHTSVRRGIPFMRATVRDAMRVEGDSGALVSEVTHPLVRLGRITRTSLSIHQGLATIGWRYPIDDEATHVLAIECLIALRGLRAPIAT